MKFRKKPEYVEAVPFQNTREGKAALCELGLDRVHIGVVGGKPSLTFDSLIGTVTCMEGDYVTREDGIFDAWNKETFERTYEAVQ